LGVGGPVVDGMTFEPPDYNPRFLFTDWPSGYPPAIAWARCHQPRPARRRSRAWGAWLRGVHLAHLAERRNALARLAQTAEALGCLPEPLVRYARRSP
jgi:hypothetical protein